MIDPFYKTRVIFKVLTYIQTARESLLEDLVAYTKDPIRYKRRIRMLIQLSDYEQNILKKIRDFETDDISDLSGHEAIELCKFEVDSIVDRDS